MPVIPTRLNRDLRPFPRSDGCHSARVVYEEVPGIAAGFHDVVVCLPHPQAQLVAPQVLPDIFDRVQLRRIRRQLDEGYIAGHFEIATRPMPPGAVDDKSRVRTWHHGFADLFKMLVHGVDIDPGHHQGRPCRACGADSTEDIGPGSPAITQSDGPGTAFGPEIRKRALLAHSGFILKPDFDRLAGGRLAYGLADDVSEVFLKEASASADLPG